MEEGLEGEGLLGGGLVLLALLAALLLGLGQAGYVHMLATLSILVHFR